jgi:5'-3' exonuclease
MRGDASDGLPGVPGVGDKTAATLLAAHGDLAGIVAAAEDGEGMSAGVRAKILAALPYLAVAPKVVEVVRDLDLDRDEGALLAAAVNAGAFGPLMPETEAEARRLAEEWSLGTAMDRALAARTAVTNG